MTRPGRKYAMTKLSAGDWICPSNDARWLYRFMLYDEDGSAENSDGPIVGQFWATARILMPKADHQLRIYDHVAWEWRADLMRSRSEAIDVMLDETRTPPPTVGQGGEEP